MLILEHLISDLLPLNTRFVNPGVLVKIDSSKHLGFVVGVDVGKCIATILWPEHPFERAQFARDAIVAVNQFKISLVRSQQVLNKHLGINKGVT